MPDHLTEADRALCDMADLLFDTTSQKASLSRAMAQRIRELSRQLAAAEADAARLAEAVEELQATPPHWEEYADVYNMAEAALAAHTARLIDG